MTGIPSGNGGSRETVILIRTQGGAPGRRDQVLDSKAHAPRAPGVPREHIPKNGGMLTPCD